MPRGRAFGTGACVKAILTYHSIDESRSPISISPEAFRGHIQYFLARDIPVVSIEALIASNAVGHAVALTFDDGFANVAAQAWPLLQEHGLPATLFVVTDHVGGTNQWVRGDRFRVPELPLLDWDAIGRLAEGGMSIGSHTRTHRSLVSLSPSRLQDEIGGAANELHRRLGRAVPGFAYPYGDVSSAVRAAAGCEHRWACTARFAAVQRDAMLDLPRVDMCYFETPGRLEQWGTPAFERWVRRRLGLRRIRRVWRKLGGR
jgi:peptidoglycan/xylan/chitin deacetylase (PgdA/CDA1 family)